MSDVTKQLTIRVIGIFVLIAVAATVAALTVLRLHPAPIERAATRPSLAARVPGAVLPTAADPVLPPAGTDAPVPSTAALRRTLEPLIKARSFGGSVSLDVLDPLTGEHLLASGQATARTPASTAKLLTCAAALSLLGPQTTLPTSVLSGARPGQLVLLAGGDVLLSEGESDPEAVNGHAGLTSLARLTAQALKARGQDRVPVTLSLDDRLFTGPARAKGWAVTDVENGYVAPVYPLEIDAGRITAADYAHRSGDPALTTARVFAGLLRKQGIDVSRSAVGRLAAPRDPVVLAEVDSAPISGLVEYALTQSDNTVAEGLGRLVAAKSGRPATFASVGPAVLAADQRLGVPVTGAVLLDGSGLSAGSKVPPLTMTELLAAAVSPQHPELRPILSGLPIAAVSGTLLNRFADPKERIAAGLVRAKTGTLTGVSSLAGAVVDADGRLLVFAVMADRVKSTTLARAGLDQVATALAGCGCR